jgi:hypothetical protein
VKQVFVAQHPTEAHVIKGLLEAEGIRAEVRGESLFGVRGEAPATGHASISLGRRRKRRDPGPGDARDVRPSGIARCSGDLARFQVRRACGIPIHGVLALRYELTRGMKSY